jgi:phosphotransferase system  glucose/maltose/N-acetylglucosamine-specific IIC component
MDTEQYELYENARRRLKQKKLVYYHFVFLFVGSLFLFIANVFLKYGQPQLWYIWICTAWSFLFILHFIKVFITDRFMNKDWERDQIDRLMQKQKNKISELSNKISQEETS